MAMKIVRTAREFVLSDDRDNSIHCQEINEQEQHSPDDFEHAIDSVVRDARPKSHFRMVWFRRFI
jgi:hypothetical protein